MKTAAVVSLAFLSLGCVAYSQVYISPDGTQAATCGASGAGLMGVAWASTTFDECAASLHAAGYTEIERAGTIGVVTTEDARVIRVVHGSPAEAAGIRANDIIVAIDGIDVHTRQEAKMLVIGTPGTALTLTLRRGDGSVILSVVRAPWSRVFGVPGDNAAEDAPKVRTPRD